MAGYREPEPLPHHDLRRPPPLPGGLADADDSVGEIDMEMTNMTPLNTHLITPQLSSTADEESTDMASWNHSWVQLQLAKTLLDWPDYTPSIELSLDLSQADLSQFNLSADRELKPDICLYPAARRGFKRPTELLRMTEMPLATIEILSPKPGTYDLKETIKAYFFLGVKSCW